MRSVWLVVLAGCGRMGFDDGGAAANDGTDGTLTTEGANVVFVSSFTVIPGQLGSVAAADMKCTTAANSAGLDGPFVAFLSGPASDAAARLAGHRGWKRPDGLPVTDTVADLAAGVHHMINLDEQETRVADDTLVVTATRSDGTLDTLSGHCSDWTVIDTSMVGSGRVDATSGGFADGGFFGACNLPSRLFCFGTRANNPLEPVSVAGRFAFVTETGWLPGGGLSSADMLCGNEATAAQLPGTYRALLPTATATAAARFDLAGPPWVRVDGARLAATPADLMTERLDTTFDLTARGTLYQGYVWSGYSDKDATVIGQSTCNSWQSGSMNQTGSLGLPAYSAFLIDSPNGGGTGGYCNAKYPLFCLQM